MSFDTINYADISFITVACTMACHFHAGATLETRAMSFDLDRNSWRAFLSGARRQISCLTSTKGPCDLAGSVKSARKSPPVRCAINSESLARLSELMAHLTGSAFGPDLTGPVGSHGPRLLVRHLTWRLGPPWNARHEFRSMSKLMACGSSVVPAWN